MIFQFLNHRRRRAFTLLELVAVVVMILILVAGVFLPALKNAKRRQQRISCINQLKNLGLAARISATTNGAFPLSLAAKNGGGVGPITPDAAANYFRSLSNVFHAPKIFACPEDDRRPAASFATLASTNVSYFIALDATETQPQLPLAGDRNIGVNRPFSNEIVSLRSSSNLTWIGSRHGPDLGNMVMGDGSVQQLTGIRLRALWSAITNDYRLLFP